MPVVTINPTQNFTVRSTVNPTQGYAVRGTNTFIGAADLQTSITVIGAQANNASSEANTAYVGVDVSLVTEKVQISFAFALPEEGAEPPCHFGVTAVPSI